MGVNRQFQARTSKYEDRNISETIHPINSKFHKRAGIVNITSWVVYDYPRANSIWLTAAILKIAMTSQLRQEWSDLDEIRYGMVW